MSGVDEPRELGELDAAAIASDDDPELGDGTIRPELVAWLLRRVTVLRQLVDAFTEDGAKTPVNVVPPAQLPAEAPGGSLWRTTRSSSFSITEAAASHVIMVSHAETVSDVILTAAAALDRPAAPAAH